MFSWHPKTNSHPEKIGHRVDGTGTPRSLLDGGPYKPPLGDCAIYSQPTIQVVRHCFPHSEKNNLLSTSQGNTGHQRRFHAHTHTFTSLKPGERIPPSPSSRNSGEPCDVEQKSALGRLETCRSRHDTPERTVPCFFISETCRQKCPRHPATPEWIQLDGYSGQWTVDMSTLHVKSLHNPNQRLLLHQAQSSAASSSSSSQSHLFPPKSCTDTFNWLLHCLLVLDYGSSAGRLHPCDGNGRRWKQQSIRPRSQS